MFLSLKISQPFARFRISTVLLAALLCAAPSWAQQAPPALGEETKGTPAIEETSASVAPETAVAAEAEEQSDNDGEQGAIDGLLGTAQITESKRENGQIYRIELEHSSGAKQYIEETDSDGIIESTPNDIEETPNLPKWKLGSW